MKKIIMLAAALLLSPLAANAALVTIDFDDLGTSVTVGGDTYADQGVIFGHTLQTGVSGALPGSLPNAVVNGDDVGGDLFGFFLGAVDFISVFAGDTGGDTDTVTLLGYDAADMLVASDTFTGTAAQTLLIGGAGIVRFEINQTGRIAIDDFAFNTVDVPAPAAWSLLLLALAGFGVARRRG